MANAKLINFDQLQSSMTKVKAYVDLNFSLITHRHDGDYYTETEIDTKVDALTSLINGKASASHNQPSNTINLMTGYNKATNVSAIAASDSLNTAIGKLEKALDSKSDTSHNHDSIYLGKTATAASANKLATARKINGISFDGTGDITIKANPNSHNQDSSTIISMTGYTKASTFTAISTSDTLNAAIGKLEKALDGKADYGSQPASHNHDDRYYTETEIDTKITDINKSISTNLNAAKTYTNNKVAALVDSAPETLNTLNELAAALGDDANFATTITNQIAGKANTNHTHDEATTTTNGFMTTDMVTKLNGIATNANNYVHPTTSGNKHIPSGGSSGQFLGWSADGTAKWVSNPNTDNKVQTTADTTTSKLYFTGATGAATGGLKYNTNVYFNAADGTITANGFNGKATSAGTADTATSCSGTAANANKVNQSLTIQLNGTNQGAWNGSSAKTINITPSSIGAPTTSDVAKATDTEVGNMLTEIFG